MVKFLSLLESRAQSLVWFTVQSLAFVLSHLYAGHFMLSGSRQQILETRVVTEGWKRQPLSPLQPYSLYGPCKYKLQAACKWEGLPIPPWQIRSPPCVLIMYRHPRHSAAKKYSILVTTRERVLAPYCSHSIGWHPPIPREISNFGSKRNRTYAWSEYRPHLIGWHPRRLAVNALVIAI